MATTKLDTTTGGSTVTFSTPVPHPSGRIRLQWQKNASGSITSAVLKARLTADANYVTVTEINFPTDTGLADIAWFPQYQLVFSVAVDSAITIWISDLI